LRFPFGAINGRFQRGNIFQGESMSKWVLEIDDEKAAGWD
jgi:hypothetical protein